MLGASTASWVHIPHFSAFDLSHLSLSSHMSFFFLKRAIIACHAPSTLHTLDVFVAQVDAGI